MVALPIGALGAFAFTSFTAGLANFDVTRVRRSRREVFALEIGVGLLVPLLAALVPVVRGVRITVREALATPASPTASAAAGWTALLRDSAASRARPSSASATRSGARAGWA